MMRDVERESEREREREREKEREKEREREREKERERERLSLSFRKRNMYFFLRSFVCPYVCPCDLTEYLLIQRALVWPTSEKLLHKTISQHFIDLPNDVNRSRTKSK